MAEAAESRDAEGLLDVGALCRMFEESEDSTYSARKESERDRDYVDNKQLTAAELSALAKRGQPPVIDNRIKTKVDYLVGLEKQQRVKPKAFPRTPKHESDADGATEALRYVSEEQDYETKRSAVWRNLLVEGAGGVGVSVEQVTDYGGQPGIEIKLRKTAWDRMFWDPHSSEMDFEDAGYKGLVVWMDYDDALAQYRDNPDVKDILDVTMASAPSDTYDDKPKFSHWADKKRKRVRICQIWVRRADQWHFAEFTKGGILKGGPSPHVTDKGESDDELVFQSAYVDRDNNRYGLVREMITLQDEINKRRSKSLHLLNTRQVFYEKGAVDKPDELRRQVVRPDGTIELNPGALKDGRIKIENGIELAVAHASMLQEAKNAIDLKGPNATEMGDKTGGSNSASGRAILASQQGGMIQIGDLMDALRHLDKRVFRKIWARVRQYWTAEKWIRVTDDEQNVKWLGLNVDPMQMQMLMQQSPEAAQKIAGVVGSVAELDCDIVIDDAPDGMTPQIEQFQALTELKKFDANNELPFKAIVRAMPNLKDKQSFLKDMEQKEQAAAPQQQAAQQIQFRGAVAEVQETESKAALNMAKAREAGMPDQPGAPEQAEPFAAEKALAEIGKLVAAADKDRAAADKTRMDTALAPAQAEHQQQQDWANFQQGIKDRDADRKIAARKKTEAA